MKKYIRVLWLGFLSWLIPFVASIPFFSRSGELLIDQGLFKSLMVVIGVLVGVRLLIVYFKEVTENHLKASIEIGIIWFALNIALDFLMLVPMSNMSATSYLYEIGIRYLSIPIISIGMGYLLKKAS